MGWYRKLVNLARRNHLDREIERELSFHIKERVDDFIASGMTEREARSRAMRQFGNYSLQKERTRDMDIFVLLDAIAKDVRYSVRGLWKNPGFTLAAITVLALGIGATTAIFGVVNTFLIRPLPYPNPDLLVAVFERNVIGDEQTMSVAPGNFLDWQKTSTSFERMSAYSFRNLTLSSGNDTAAPERVGVCDCSGNLFATLGVQPAAGRMFLPEEDRFGGPRVVVISHELWQRQYAGSADAIGKHIRLDGNDYEVIGVMPRGFLFPRQTVEAWRPLLTGLPPQQQIRHDVHYLSVVARLREGISMDQAFAELDGIAARYKTEHPDEATGKGVTVVPLHGSLVVNVRNSLRVLLAAVGCVLLIACVNIASLVLSRAAGRNREIAIRAAMGAGRSGIIRQLLTESLILAFAGGMLGAILAVSITGLLVSKQPAAQVLIPAGGVPVDPKVFLFAFGIAVLSGVGVGLYPAIRVSRFDLANDLKSGGRSLTVTRAHGRLRSGLVATEVALSVILLIASGLLLRSFFLLYQVQPGIRMDQSLTLAVSVPFANYRQPAQRSVLLNELSARLQTIPGVRSAALTSCAPLSGVCNILFYYVDGRPFVLGKFLTAHERSVDPAYFATAGIPLLRGRTFTKQDGIGFDPNNPKLGSILISETMARTVFPNEDPIGKRIFFDFEVQRERIEGTPVPRYEVIGVVGDVLPAMEGQLTATLYRPLLDVANAGATVLLHTAVEPKSVTSAVRETIRQVDPGLAVYGIRTMNEQVDVSTAGRQFDMLLFGAFAGLALLLALIGLYGLVSHTVSQRRNEIGIRMTLGATSADINRLILLQGLKPALAGLTLGLVGAAAATRVLRSQLFRVSPVDAVTFVIVAIVLLAVALLAGCLPARRATRFDPTVPLRAE